uniref:hypothetical protein n=1 Tax=Bacillus pumilus TaxID=1408 RepID=UPI001C92E36E
RKKKKEELGMELMVIEAWGGGSVRGGEGEVGSGVKRLTWVLGMGRGVRSWVWGRKVMERMLCEK